jgi:hypothetical protein
MDWLNDCLIKPNNFTLQLHFTVWHVCRGSWFELSNPRARRHSTGSITIQESLEDESYQISM